jgi:hypothetical protein
MEMPSTYGVVFTLLPNPPTLSILPLTAVSVRPFIGKGGGFVALVRIILFGLDESKNNEMTVVSA